MMRVAAIFMVAGIASGLALAEDDVVPPPEDPLPTVAPKSDYRWGGVIVPLVNYNTTDGLGFGVGGEFYDRRRGQDSGYRNRLTPSVFWTTSGNYGSVILQYERSGRHLLFARATYLQWRNIPYVGVGGRQVSVDRPEEESTGNTVQGPTLLLTGMYGVKNTPVMLWAQLYGRYAYSEAKPGGILDQSDAFGRGKALYTDVSLGLAVRETDRWPLPNRGVSSEVSVRLGGTFSEQNFEFLSGTHVEVAGWWPVVGQWLVIGGRSVFDRTWGQRPFWDKEWLGGLRRDEVAYEQMLTGYGRSHVRGDGLVATLIEIRPYFGKTRHDFFDIGFYASLFAETAHLIDGSDPGPHMPTLGVAPELLWQGATQLRPFVAFGLFSDTVGGPRDWRPQVGISLLGPL